MKVVVVDYGAGNLQSVLNALNFLQIEHSVISDPTDLRNCRVILPGVGSFSASVELLKKRGLFDILVEHVRAGRPFLGICIGFQLLAHGSQESQDGCKGFGVFPDGCTVDRFQVASPVPQMGWNLTEIPPVDTNKNGWESWVAEMGRFYFVHSYRLGAEFGSRLHKDGWNTLTTRYCGESFIAWARRGEVIGTQFHPEKSGLLGLQILARFAAGDAWRPTCCINAETKENIHQHVVANSTQLQAPVPHTNGLAKRIIACLDVRAIDDGRLAVTKGDQYDVREGGKVRDLGNPVDLARNYFEQGIDELTFLSIKSYCKSPLTDNPMLAMIRETAKRVFVPLCVGGGVRDTVEVDAETKEERKISAVEIAAAYFRAGADKISIGTDAVAAAEKWIAAERNGECLKDGSSSIEQISQRFGCQAVVLSVDAKRVVVKSENVESLKAEGKHVISRPTGNSFCWYRATTKGGREERDIDVVDLIRACENLGIGEILLNCIDQDGTNLGFDIPLIQLVKANTDLPVIASSGAGVIRHFVDVFQQTGVDAALAAGVFHRQEIAIDDVKASLAAEGLPVRR